MVPLNKIILKGLLITLLGLPFFSQISFSQEIKDSNTTIHVGGGVTVTNNGISLLPSFSLGKPASIFDLSVGNRFSFEPQFRVALEGKPWAFIFWFRYKLIDKSRFSIRIGAHPSVLFKTLPVAINGSTVDKLVADRFIAGEIVPDYQLTKNISIGMYYLKGHGLQDDNIRDSDFITLNSNFSNIKLSDKFFMKFNPQVYYLRMDEMNGFYFSATTTLAMYDFPLSVESIINQPFETDIAGGEDFLWNVSLVYSFSNQLVKK